jgi:hypothetical protein
VADEVEVVLEGDAIDLGLSGFVSGIAAVGFSSSELSSSPSSSLSSSSSEDKREETRENATIKSRSRATLAELYRQNTQRNKMGNQRKASQTKHKQNDL